MPSYTFDHVHLYSPDPQQTAEFYEKKLGAKRIGVTEIVPGRFITKLDLHGVTLLISKSKENMPAGLVHFGIKTDKLEKSIAELKTGGVKFTQEATQINPSLKISFLQAPDNVAIELQEGGV
ncbi:MAG: VOC family protein [Dehalococcoidales bacterium]|nr:VOC family protein [Dehalococcoidales bacterium]